MKSQPAIVGVDVGGSHITVGLVNISDSQNQGQPLVRRKVNPHAEANVIVREWSETISRVTKGKKDVRLGIAMPGPFDYMSGVSLIRDQGKFEALYGLNVKSLLAKELGILPEAIHLINDASCFLHGEVFTGAAKGVDCAVGVTLGTGLGSAIYREGLVIDADLWKYPFKEGAAEDYLCTRWFTKRFLEETREHVKGVKEICESCRNILVMQLFTEFSENLADFLSCFIIETLPEVIVIGGNIANAHGLFLDKVQERLNGKGIKVPIRKTILGEKAAMVGAASYWYSKGNRIASTP